MEMTIPHHIRRALKQAGRKLTEFRSEAELMAWYRGWCAVGRRIGK